MLESAARWFRVLLIVAASVLGAAIVGILAFLFLTRNPPVPDFFTPPDQISSSPGTILRSEQFTTGIPEGARAWRILYSSTDDRGRPIAVSGLVVAPADPEPGPHPVLAWAHGTTGIDRACAPSVSDAPLEGFPDISGVLAQGWVVALTDYPGLGTPGPHPYLVGRSQAHAVLDSVRAAHSVGTGITLDDRYAIWGHSQGGHAALFAGQMAAEYLPEQELVGVAALAPATDVADNLAAVADTESGGVLTLLTVEAWRTHYPDIPEDTLTEDARRVAARLVLNCINQPSRLRLLVAGFTLPDELLSFELTSNAAWARHLEANTPTPTGVVPPLFVGQGLDDELFDADVTTAWVDDRCHAGAPTRFRTYADVDHEGVLDPGGADALTFTIDRFAGTTAQDACPGS